MTIANSRRRNFCWDCLRSFCCSPYFLLQNKKILVRPVFALAPPQQPEHRKLNAIQDKEQPETQRL